MDPGQSVTRHAKASRAAFETLYAAFASQPAGVTKSHRTVLDSLQNELRLDESFVSEVEQRHSDRIRERAECGAAGEGQGSYRDGEGPAIQIAWKEVCHCHL